MAGDNDLMDLDDKRRLELTLSTRENIIKKMMPNGGLPGNAEDRDFLMKAMDGLDRTILAKTRLKVDDQAAKSQADISALVGNVLARIDVNKMAVPIPGTRQSLAMDIKVETVPGETDLGTHPFDTEVFMDDERKKQENL